MRTELNEFDYVFNATAVAVIGASGTQGFTESLMKTKMKERLFLVNPNRRELFGSKCYASILDVEERIDYVIIEVPVPCPR